MFLGFFIQENPLSTIAFQLTIFLSHLECAWYSISILYVWSSSFETHKFLLEFILTRGFMSTLVTSPHVLWHRYDARAKNVTLLGDKLTQSIFWSPVGSIAKLSTKEKKNFKKNPRLLDLVGYNIWQSKKKILGLAVHCCGRLLWSIVVVHYSNLTITVD